MTNQASLPIMGRQAQIFEDQRTELVAAIVHTAELGLHDNAAGCPKMAGVEKLPHSDDNLDQSPLRAGRLRLGLVMSRHVTTTKTDVACWSTLVMDTSKAPARRAKLIDLKI